MDNNPSINEILTSPSVKLIEILDNNTNYAQIAIVGEVELQKEKNELMGEIFKTETEILEMEKGNVTIDYKEIRKLANEIISTENPSKELYSKLIEKIEFDSEKNIIVTLTFGEITMPKKIDEAV